MLNFYEILSVSKKATSNQILEAYEALASKWDYKDDSLQKQKDKFYEIKDAFNILYNPDDRVWYDSNMGRLLTQSSNHDNLLRESDIKRFSHTEVYNSLNKNEIGNFFNVYDSLFKRISEEELTFCSQLDQIQFPLFCPKENNLKLVNYFYTFWENYTTKRNFTHIELIDLTIAPNKRILEVFKSINDRELCKKRSKFNISVKKLIKFLKTKDPRYLQFQKMMELGMIEESEISLGEQDCYRKLNKTSIVEEENKNYEPQHQDPQALDKQQKIQELVQRAKSFIQQKQLQQSTVVQVSNKQQQGQDNFQFPSENQLAKSEFVKGPNRPKRKKKTKKQIKEEQQKKFMTAQFKSSSDSSFELKDSDNELDFFANKQVKLAIEKSQIAEKKQEELWEQYDEIPVIEEAKEVPEGFEVSNEEKKKKRVKANLKFDPQDGNLLVFKQEQIDPNEEGDPYWKNDRYFDDRGLTCASKQSRFRPKNRY